MLCLGIESSCDETALAVVRDGVLLDAVLASQADIHALFGGVVPELASREHYRYLGTLFDQLMQRLDLRPSDLDVVAVSRGPGLLGSLLVGVAFAKALALGCGARFLGVNHLHAHLLAAGLENELRFPALGLLVSGGHTHIYRMESPSRCIVLGKTLDDAAGEAFDKVGKILGLAYPGGKLMDALARQGRADARLFPRPYLDNDNLDFSFSGLKTAALTYLNEHPVLVEEGRRVREAGTDSASPALCDVCASYMLAVAETLSLKMEKAFHRERQKGITGIVVAGGVAANTQVRAAMHVLAEKVGKPLLLPSRFLCTDNAVMIAHAGELLACKGYGQGLAFPAIPRGQKLPDDLGELRAPLHSL